MWLYIGTGDHYLSTAPCVGNYDITIFKFWGGGILAGGGKSQGAPPPPPPLYETLVWVHVPAALELVAWSWRLFSSTHVMHHDTNYLFNQTNKCTINNETNHQSKVIMLLHAICDMEKEEQCNETQE